MALSLRVETTLIVVDWQLKSTLQRLHVFHGNKSVVEMCIGDFELGGGRMLGGIESEVLYTILRCFIEIKEAS